jgi:hypothetical protein
MERFLFVTSNTRVNLHNGRAWWLFISALQPLLRALSGPKHYLPWLQNKTTQRDHKQLCAQTVCAMTNLELVITELSSSSLVWKLRSLGSLCYSKKGNVSSRLPTWLIKRVSHTWHHRTSHVTSVAIWSCYVQASSSKSEQMWQLGTVVHRVRKGRDINPGWAQSDQNCDMQLIYKL